MCGPCREVVHVGLEILDDPRLVCGRDVGAGMVEGQRADGGIVRLQDGFKVERQPVPSREFPTRGTGQYAATLWRSLGATLGREQTDETRTKCMNCDGNHGIHRSSNFVLGRVDNCCAERCRGVVCVGLWR